MGRPRLRATTGGPSNEYQSRLAKGLTPYAPPKLLDGVYTDYTELKKVMDHTDDLSHQMVVDRLLADMHEKGVTVSEPNDPLHDVDWIQALMHTYTIAPTTDWLAV